MSYNVLDTWADLPDMADDTPVSRVVIVEEDADWDLRDLTSKKNHVPSTLQRLQKFFQAHRLAKPSDVHAVPKILKEPLAVLASADKDEV